MDDAVQWLEWSGDAFARARAEGIPVLLALGTRWCPWSAAMVRETYADPTVVDLIRERFVPIRADADARPDINDRYSLGGWPTTAFLTPDGLLLGGETYVPPERMRELLARVSDAFRTRRQEISARAHQPEGQRATGPADAAPDPAIAAWVARQLAEQFDAEHGGFGAAPKRVHAAALEFASVRHREGDDALAAIVPRTLDAIAWGGLYDPVDGGAFRFCAGSDWSEPSVEKLLDVNAAVLRLLVAGDEGHHERAAHLIGYVRRTLVDDPEAGGFYASQQADATYYGTMSGSERRALDPPSVDRTIYADGNATMAAAFTRAALALSDTSLVAFAAMTMERVVLDTYERGGGIAHQAGEQTSGGVRGLLVDQVRASAALLDLYEATERDAYLDMAQELMRYATRTLWDGATGGGFVDRVSMDEDVGLLREPLRPFGPNCEAARVLARLARHAGNPEYRERAVAALASQNGVARAHGIDAAVYALALHELAATYGEH